MGNFNEVLKGIKGKTLLVVFPHPDDESMMTGGLLLESKRLDIKTVVVILTKGGAGKVHIHPRGKSISEIREKELKKAARHLKVDRLVIGNFTDGKLRQERSKWRKWLLGIINNEIPNIIITYDHSGLTGHPDHIALSLEVLDIARIKNLDLYWVSLSNSLIKRFVPPNVRFYFHKPNWVLGCGKHCLKKWLAIKSHRSQRFAQINTAFPLILFLLYYHFEWYHKVDVGKNYQAQYIDFKI